MFIDRLYDFVFQSAHLVLHYQLNLVGLIFTKAKIDISTLVATNAKLVSLDLFTVRSNFCNYDLRCSEMALKQLL